VKNGEPEKTGSALVGGFGTRRSSSSTASGGLVAGQQPDRCGRALGERETRRGGRRGRPLAKSLGRSLILLEALTELSAYQELRAA